MWALWVSRNKLIHERESQSVDEVVTFIRGYMQEYRDLTLILKHPNPSAMVRWPPPPPSWVKTNVDASYSISNKKQHQDVKALSRSFSARRFNFIARGGNTVAHAFEGHRSPNIRPLFHRATMSFCIFGSCSLD
ncbi:hypothetical protein Goari_009938 [Gossypium aridum]|uniref:Uncharacterized protein n=1 Tax=Gossypium aridum TaxID=34290 RepID=A0A7J8Y033_GOSAI|nr:hypothetical protein [Gossypium aridum]